MAQSSSPELPEESDPLTTQQELTLAKRVETGAWAEERLGGLDELTPAERTTLERQVQDAETAQRQLIRSNLPRVASIADNHADHGLNRSELITAGQRGLIRAAEKFDYRKGFSFRAYAAWWIEAAITRRLGEEGPPDGGSAHDREPCRPHPPEGTLGAEINRT